MTAPAPLPEHVTTLRDALGGSFGRIKAMTGAKHFVYGESSLRFTIPSSRDMHFRYPRVVEFFLAGDVVRVTLHEIRSGRVARLVKEIPRVPLRGLFAMTEEILGLRLKL